MKPSGPSLGAFTILEMLSVVSIVMLLALLLVPALNQTGDKARRAHCLSNLHQTGLAFHSFLHDHGDAFPMDVSTNNGGTSEVLEASYLSHGEFYLASVHFQALSNDLGNARVLICPTDLNRSTAADFASLGNKSVSYFVGANADPDLANSILAGDRNITGAAGSPRSLVRLNEENPAGWTREMHGLKGNQLFADGHVERVNQPRVRLPRRNAPSMMDLMLPTIKSSAPPSALASLSAPELSALLGRPGFTLP